MCGRKDKAMEARDACEGITLATYRYTSHRISMYIYRKYIKSFSLFCRTSRSKHSVLSSELNYNPSLSSAQKELHQPVALKVQPSPSKMYPSATETSRTVSATGGKGW